jgi:hypothetical protein
MTASPRRHAQRAEVEWRLAREAERMARWLRRSAKRKRPAEMAREEQQEVRDDGACPRGGL